MVFVKTPVIPIPAVNGALVDSQGRVLLTRRSPNIREPGKWCLPGGHLDPGETWEEALVRELREEIGIEVEKFRLFGIYGDPKWTITEAVLPEGHRARFVVACYVIESFRGEVRPDPREVDRWDWFSADALPSPMIRSHPIRIDDVLRFQGEVYVR